MFQTRQHSTSLVFRHLNALLNDLSATFAQIHRAHTNRENAPPVITAQLPSNHCLAQKAHIASWHRTNQLLAHFSRRAPRSLIARCTLVVWYFSPVCFSSSSPQSSGTKNADRLLLHLRKFRRLPFRKERKFYIVASNEREWTRFRSNSTISRFQSKFPARTRR